ncbi:MAG TPA: DUF2459 domain-containing protein [Caulobacteraceae bacterium]|jgi:hypothetical protein|nr:DUF2459 domain-containing protein [Caulobacteraceae bacterium]
MSTPAPKVEPLIVPRASEIPPAKWPRVVIAVGALVVAVILFVVLTARGGDRSLYPGAAGQARTTVFLVENGFHSNLVVPRAALFAKPHVTALATAVATDKPWVSIGWGDAKFYAEEGSGAGRLLSGVRALLAPGNRSVVHIEGLNGSPDRIYADGVRPIQLSDAGLEKALSRVDKSLDTDSDGQPQRTDAPRRPDEGFFRSVEHFSLIHLCNHWTAELLNAAGLSTTPVIDTLPAGLELDLSMRDGVK